MDPEIIIAELAEPPDAPVAVPYGVPRRFGISTIMVVTAAFAGLLGLLRWLGAPPLVVGLCVVFVSLVGLGQAVLFRGRRPRRASIVTGIACFAVFGAVLFIRERIGMRGPGSASVGGSLVCAAIWAVPFGAVCGYLAGGVVAGLFLVMDSIDRLIGRKRTKPTSTE